MRAMNKLFVSGRVTIAASVVFVVGATAGCFYAAHVRSKHAEQSAGRTRASLRELARAEKRAPTAPPRATSRFRANFVSEASDSKARPSEPASFVRATPPSAPWQSMGLPPFWREGAAGAPVLHMSDFLVRYVVDSDGPASPLDRSRVEHIRKHYPMAATAIRGQLERLAAQAPAPWENDVFQSFSILNADSPSWFPTYRGAIGRDFTATASPESSASWYVSSVDAARRADVQAKVVRVLEEFQSARAQTIAALFRRALELDKQGTFRVDASACVAIDGQVFIVPPGEVASVDEARQSLRKLGHALIEDLARVVRGGR